MSEPTIPELTPMEPTIRQFTIKALFGEKDVSIRFDSGVTILIADNGEAKTTILTVIYAVLAGHLHRLRRIDFELIRVEFTNGAIIEIPFAAIEAPLNLSGSDPGIKRLLRQVPEQSFSISFSTTLRA